MDITAILYTLLMKPIAGTLAFLGINPAHLVAGIFGAAVKSLVDRTRNIWEIGTTMFVGGMCASYLTPIVNQWVKPDGIEANNGMAFVIGTIGVSLTQYALRLSRSYSEAAKLPKIIDQFNPPDEPPKA